LSSATDFPTPLKSGNTLRFPAIAISGPSGSGKTRLICRLLEWFAAQGLKVAVLKHTHHRQAGDESKDTGQFRRAGACLSALAAPGLLQLTRSYPSEPSLPDLLAELTREADLILVEGYKSSDLPKLALPDRRSSQVPDYPHVVALVAPVAPASELPVFQPDQTEGIGRFILDFLQLTPGRAEESR
jgi:molybdopterin-guanine dinucleotide biosynthesis protein B